MNKLITLLLVGGALTFCKAQRSLYGSIRPAKTHYKYLGIQANLLLQQFISFNSNSSINTNPYLFTYSRNDIATGRGIVFGTGFSANESSSNDGVTFIHTRNINLAFRFGSEKKYLQGERFIPFWGIEGSAGLVYSLAESRLNQSINPVFVSTESTRFFAGPAFRGGLNLALSRHIQLGIEFFFNLQIAFSNINGQQGFISDQIPFSIGFQAPTALFLIFKY